MIDKAKAKTIHADLDATLKAFAAKHGLTFVPSRATYSTKDFKVHVHFGDKAELGDLNPLYVRDLEKYGYRFNLDKTMLNKNFKPFPGKNETFKFVGMKGEKILGLGVSGIDGKGRSNAGNLYVFPAVHIAPAVRVGA